MLLAPIFCYVSPSSSLAVSPHSMNCNLSFVEFIFYCLFFVCTISGGNLRFVFLCIPVFVFTLDLDYNCPACTCIVPSGKGGQIISIVNFCIFSCICISVFDLGSAKKTLVLFPVAKEGSKARGERLRRS